MARSAEAKLRRRNKRKEEAAVTQEIFGNELSTAGSSDFDAPVDGSIPLPPGMAEQAAAADHDSDEDAAPKKKTKSKPKSGASSGGGGNGGGIKTLPLIFLILMTGTTLLPMVLYASDYVRQNNVLGSIGFRLGIGAVPRKRVLSFYEKHDPTKIPDVPKILSKHYGEYPKLIKRLERKYQDYGYFVGWEDDEAPMRLALEQVRATYDAWITGYWNRYAPQVLKTAARNIRYNVTFLLKRFRKVWKKHIWPVLEPVFGVPKGIEKQKRADAAEARKRKAGASKGTRRRNTDFRDDDEED